MELVTKRVEKDALCLQLHGRIDASNAQEAEAQISAIRAEHPGMIPVLDAEDLLYISSAGLRVVLRLRKEIPQLKLINVNSEVYDILEMTGFTDILTVEKAFRRLSLEGCELIAAGANGRVYRYDPETIVKIYFNGATLEEIRLEKDLCRKMFVKGINTAIPYDVVKVDDYYGSVAELLSAASVAKLIRTNPEKIDEYMQIYVDLLKTIHSTPVEPGEMPPAKATGVKWVKFLEPHLPAEQYTKLISMMEAIPEPLTIVHGDYHANNVMVQNGEPLLIDMDTVGYGHPIFDFAAIYLGFLGFSELDHEVSQKFYKLDHDTVVTMWNLAMEKYFNGDKDMIRDVQNKATIIAQARLLRRTIRKDSANTAQIEVSRKHLADLLPLVDRLDY